MSISSRVACSFCRDDASVFSPRASICCLPAVQHGREDLLVSPGQPNGRIHHHPQDETFCPPRPKEPDSVADRSGRLLAQNTEQPHPGVGAAGGCNALTWPIWGVYNVHTLGFGLGRTGAGLGRIPHVFGSSQCLQGRECSSSPTSGTAYPLVRGVFALTCVQSLWWRPSDARFAGCGLAAAVACSGVWGGGFRVLAGGPSACCDWGYAFLSWIVAAWLAAYLFMVRACLDDMTRGNLFQSFFLTSCSELSRCMGLEGHLFGQGGVDIVHI